jgi:hypothetical protein
MSADPRPTTVGWWWLCTPDDRAIDGWLPVRVYSSHRGLTFRNGSTETPVADGHTWGGRVARVDPLPIAEAYRLGRAHERADVADFIESPPGPVPEVHRRCLGEMRSAIRGGVHEGWGKRLYETPPPKAAAMKTGGQP